MYTKFDLDLFEEKLINRKNERYMHDNNKNYYHNLFKQTLKEIEERHERPRLLLYCCCGPCLCYPLSILYKYFDITLIYTNPNIYPMQEYELRYKTLTDFALRYSKDHGFQIKIIKIADDFSAYMDSFKKLSDMKEGQSRCTMCHKFRMMSAFNYAIEHSNDYDYFTTIMTVSSRKPSDLINLIGEELNEIGQNYNIKYLFSDFKKENGCNIGVQISRDYGLYRQNYCGCNYSYLLRNYLNMKKENNERE